MTPEATNAQLDRNRRAILSTIRAEALTRPWSPPACEIVAIIDGVMPC